MSIIPTISAYAPFHQSSAGYGMLVDGTMEGTYDIGVTDPDGLDVAFAVDPETGGGSWHVFVGDHPTVLAEYTALTGRAPVPPDYIFRHWRGRDEFPVGEPVEYDGVLLNPAVADELQHYDELGLPPPGVFHLDRPWGTGPEGYGRLQFDTERFPDPEGMLQLLQDRGSHPWVWISNWAIGARGREARRLGYLGPDTDRAIDFTNPEAAAWYREDLTDFLASPEGSLVDGFFIDRGDEPDVASDPDDEYADGRTGAEIHNAYPVLMQENVRRVHRRGPTRGRLRHRPGGLHGHPGPGRHLGRRHPQPGRVPDPRGAGHRRLHRPRPPQRAGEHPAGGLPGPALLGVRHRRLLRVRRP